jgi:hypothetical protein
MGTGLRISRRVVGRHDGVAVRAISAPPHAQSGTPPSDVTVTRQRVPPAPSRMPQGEYLSGGLKKLLDDSVALEKLLRDTVEAQRTRPPVGTERFHVGLWRGSGGSGQRLRRTIATIVLAALAAIAIFGLLNLKHRSSPSVKVGAAAIPAEIVTAVSWTGRELPHDAKILADPTVRAELAADGFTHVQTAVASSSAATLTFDYAVSTPALRNMARTGNSIDRALQGSLPVAAFSSGARQVVVRQVSTTSSAANAALRSTDSETRRSAERELLSNPAVRALGPARTALQAGELDLRAATILALMANSSHVDLISVNVDAAERAAGLPARSVDVRTDAAGAVRAMLNNLPPLYEPIADTQLPNGTYRMTWSLDPEPPPKLN